jgi:succinate dehydrogenase/fumarate reductase flavoprotein subunit
MKQTTRLIAWILSILMLGIFPVSAETKALQYVDTIAWDGEYDVVVVGFGGAGAVTASYAARAGANVLLTEKAPKGHEGGNTKVCGQLVVTADNREKATIYYKTLAGHMEYPEKQLNVYIDGMLNMKELLVKDYGVETVYSGRENPIVAPAIPEFPELPGNETIDLVTVTPKISNAALWELLRNDVIKRHESIDVWYESPGKHLIQDPISKTILGVQIEKQGQMVNIRAKNGVVLTTGGFENNAEMRETYLGLPRAAVAGSLYNTGDGIRMAQEVGADLWHMSIWEGVGGYGGASFVVSEGEHAALLIMPSHYNNGSLIVVDQSGNRFIDENFWPRHGHVAGSGTWVHPQFPERFYLIYDAAQKAIFDSTGAIFDKFQNQVVVADTLDLLAEEIGAANLSATVSDYNHFVEVGKDYAFGRNPDSMTAFSDGPYYAIELMPLMLNTQGGPRRDEEARIIGLDGNPIPHLYSAGELGGITAHLYQGGGNMSECLIYGRIAGTNAAKPKDTTPVTMEKIESNIVYTIGKSPDPVIQDEIVLAENEYLGESTGMGGELIVKVTLDNDVIKKIEIIKHMETKGIAEPALEQIPAAIVAANSVEVDTVSKATLTSNAIINAVKDALNKTK